MQPMRRKLREIKSTYGRLRAFGRPSLLVDLLCSAIVGKCGEEKYPEDSVHTLMHENMTRPTDPSHFDVGSLGADVGLGRLPWFGLLHPPKYLSRIHFGCQTSRTRLLLW